MSKENFNEVNININNGIDEQKETDSTATVIAYIFAMLFLVFSILYLSPWFVSISSVFKLIVTVICGDYLYQCIRWFWKAF